MMKSLAQPWFQTQRIRDDSYYITEPHYSWGNRASLWLIKGRDSDLLIDTGLLQILALIFRNPI